VFFRRDDNLSKDSEYVYLYLNNKTFVNAHLIKKGLVDVDIECDFKYKERFLKYTKG
jgi:hypothetical protein